MKNSKKWKSTKLIFSQTSNRWGTNPAAINKGSLHIAKLQAEKYEKVITKYAEGRLLDCGCGTAPYYGLYRDLVDSVECIDWENSPHEISYADKSVDLNNKLPYKSKSFDTVLLADVLEHIAYPEKLFSEIERVLSKDGKLICFVPFMYWVHEEPHDYHRYTRFALEKFCSDNSLKVIELKPYGGGPDVAIDTVSKLAKRSVFFKVFALFLSLYTKFGAYKSLKSRTMNKMPMGYVLVAEKIKV